MLPWMCGRQTLPIVVSSPCMMQAQIIVAVVAARLAAGDAPSPLTPPAFAAGRCPMIVCTGIPVSIAACHASHRSLLPVPWAANPCYKPPPADEEVPHEEWHGHHRRRRPRRRLRAVVSLEAAGKIIEPGDDL